MKPPEATDDPGAPAANEPAASAEPSPEATSSEAPPPEDAQPEEKPPLARRIRRYALEGALVLGVFFAVSHFQTADLAPTGEQAPELELRDLSGKRVSLADLHGKRVLLHFWATWCGVCQHEVGALNATQRSLSKDEVLLTVVADGDNRKAIDEFVKERGADYPILLGNEEVVRRFHVSMFPTSYYLDAEGRVAAATVGMSNRFAMQTRLGCAK